MLKSSDVSLESHVSTPFEQQPDSAPAPQAVVRDNSLRMISMRVQKDVISQLKAIAARKGIGYQPYIRMLLTEHIAEASRS